MADLRRLPLTVVHFVRELLSALLTFLPRVLGRWQWQPPSWIPSVWQQCRRFGRNMQVYPKRTLTAIGLVIAVAAGMIWYLNLPEPHYAGYSFYAPPLTEYDQNGMPNIHPMKVSFSESVAPLKNVEKQITEGIQLSPVIAGTWFWVNDHYLMFTPKDDWPIDTSFKVKFASKG